LTTAVSPSGSGTITANPSGTWYNDGASVQLTASAATGYSFSSWTGGVTGSTNPTSITMNSAKSVTANFTQNQYTLTVNVSPSGSGSVAKNASKSTYAYGEQVVLTATPGSGYAFSSWSGDASGSANPITLTINGNKSVALTFSTILETVSTPTTPSGTARGTAGTSYSYSTGGSSSNYGNTVQYLFDWGDGTDSGWLSLGTTIAAKVWTTAGTYSLKAKARCVTHTAAVSVWSGARTVKITDPYNPNKKIADFNGDGKPDILWRHKTGGGVYAWYMDGGNLSGGSWIAESSNLIWEIAGTGDFNGDGKADILWKHQTSGGVYVWYMDGSTLSSSSWIATSSDINWVIVGTGDFNGDGKIDILWKHKTTGGVYVWYMNGVNQLSGVWMLDSSDTNWEIVAP
jgi:hypothetical protein